MLNGLIIPPPIWLAIATLGWYVTSRTIAGASVRGLLPVIAFALPFATICAAALLLGHSEIAIGVTLAGSVAGLTLVLGLVGLTHPIVVADSPPKHWLFVLPTALICLLIGFSGEIRVAHALALLLQGIAILIGCRTSAKRSGQLDRRLALKVVALLAMFVASLLAVRTANVISRDLQQPSSGLVAAVMLAPALVLPMIGFTSRMAGDRASAEATDLIVKVVLINLCVLLPLSALAWQVRPAFDFFDTKTGGRAPATMPATQSTTEPSDPVDPPNPKRFAYPLSVWRIDTLLILSMGIALLLLAFGRIQFGRPEAAVLLLIYIIYLGISAVAAR